MPVLITTTEKWHAKAGSQKTWVEIRIYFLLEAPVFQHWLLLSWMKRKTETFTRKKVIKGLVSETSVHFFSLVLHWCASTWATMHGPMGVEFVFFLCHFLWLGRLYGHTTSSKRYYSHHTPMMPETVPPKSKSWSSSCYFLSPLPSTKYWSHLRSNHHASGPTRTLFASDLILSLF